MRIAIIITLLFLMAGGGVLFIKQSHKDGLVPAGNSSGPAPSASGIRYLPLGDSYTIGEGVTAQERWPNQLAAKLQAQNINIVANPAVTGYTTQDLIDKELPLISKTNPDFVTILIGVNDYVQGIPVETSKKNFQYILDTVSKSVPASRIVVVTIPDYSKTPTGMKFGDPAAASKAIQSFNEFMMQEATSRRILSVNIYPVSQKVSSDPSLVARDGLHPSGVQYKLWTDLIVDALNNAKSL